MDFVLDCIRSLGLRPWVGKSIMEKRFAFGGGNMRMMGGWSGGRCKAWGKSSLDRYSKMSGRRTGDTKSINTGQLFSIYLEFAYFLSGNATTNVILVKGEKYSPSVL